MNSQYSHLSPWCLFCQWTFHSIGGNQRQRHKTMPLPLQCERAFSGQIFNISYIAKVIAKCKGTFIIYSDVRNHSHWVCDSSSRYWGFYLFFLRVLVSPHLSTHTGISFITVQTQNKCSGISDSDIVIDTSLNIKTYNCDFHRLWCNCFL